MFNVTPIVSERSLDCGPTCLKMLLEYYNINVDLEQLISECNVKINGCTVGDLRRVANLHGLDVTIWDDRSDDPEIASAKIDMVINQDRPAIVWWKHTHFCIFCGKNNKNEVVIINPDSGKFPISQGTFKSFYSGVSITHGTPETIEDSGDADTITISIEDYNYLRDIVEANEEVFT